MQYVVPQPFTFESGPRAVLLLHAFTGHTGDVRMLGRFLEGKGYTCHGPLYRGHGESPEQLMQTNPEAWWQDVLTGYSFLKENGYDEIAVAGLSLGGLFSLKLGYTVPVKAIIPMCAPMSKINDALLIQGMTHFAREYKQRIGKTTEQIATEIASLQLERMLPLMEQVSLSVRERLPSISAPTFVVQARKDTLIDLKSAEMIYNKIEAPLKALKWYEQSGHVITQDKERHLLHEDVYQFLERLNWQQ